MRILVIGGARHGEWVETLDGTKVWLDIEHATQHRIRKVHSNITVGDKVTEAYVLYLAVHADLVGPTEVQMLDQALKTIAVNAFTRAHGEPQEIPREPAGSSLVVPGS